MAPGGARDPRHRGPGSLGCVCSPDCLSGSLSLESLALNRVPSALPAVALSVGPMLCARL